MSRASSSCGEPPFVVALLPLASLLAALPPSIEVLRLRGWAVAMEPCAVQTASDAARLVAAASPNTVEQLRATLRARASAIAASLRDVSALLSLLSVRLPKLRELSWVATAFGPGLLPTVVTSAPSMAAAMRASLRSGLANMRSLAKLSLPDALDDASAAALSSALPSVRCLCIAVGPGFTDAGCTALGSMGELRVLRLEACANGSGRASVTAAGVAALVRPREGIPRALRVLSVCVGSGGVEEAEVATRFQHGLEALEIFGDEMATRFIRRTGTTGLVACGAPEFEAAWEIAWEEKAGNKSC